MSEQLYRWVKASHELPPTNVLVVIKESNGEVYSDKALSWDKQITDYEWLEPYTVPVDVEQAAEDAAKEYAKKQGTHDRPDITHWDYKQGFIAGSTYVNKIQ